MTGLAGALTYPLDTIRRTCMLGCYTGEASMATPLLGELRAAELIYNRAGVSGFFAGAFLAAA